MSKTIEWEMSLRHGVLMGTINTAIGSAAIAMVAKVAHVSPVFPAILTALGAAVLWAVGVGGGKSGAALVFPPVAWIAAGGWVTGTIATTPWSLTALCILIGGAVIGGLAAVACRGERQRTEEPDRPRRLIVASRQTKLAMEWEARLCRVCNVRGSRIVGVEEWAEKTGYTLDVELPIGGVTWKQIASFEEALASDSRLPEGCGVEVSAGVNRGTCLIRVSTVNALLDEYPFPKDYSPASIDTPFPLGRHRDASLAMATLRWICGLLVGDTGSGKTNQLQVINGQLVRCTDALVWHIDITGGGISIPWLRPWHEGRVGKPAVDWAASTPEEALALTEAVLRIIKTRKSAYQDRMRAADDDKIPVDADVPQIVVIADEFANLPRRIQDNLEEISNTGRATGARVLNCALRGTQDVVSALVKKMARLRIGMRVTDQDELAYLFGWNGKVPVPEDAPYEGCGFIKIGSDAPRPFKGFRLRPSQIEEIAVAVADLRPSLDALSVQAAGPAYAQRFVHIDRLFTTNKEIPMSTFPPTGNTGDAQPFGTPASSFAEAHRNLEESRAALRREVAQATGHDPQLDEQFNTVVANLRGEIIDWSDPTQWPDAIDKAPIDQPTPAPRRDPRERMLELLAEAGTTGSSPKALAELLNAEGHPTVRQTVADWLSDEIKSGRVLRPKTGVYINRDATPDSDSE